MPEKEPASIAILNNDPQIMEMLELALGLEGYRAKSARLADLIDNPEKLKEFVQPHQLVIYELYIPYKESLETYRGLISAKPNPLEGKQVILSSTGATELEKCTTTEEKTHLIGKPFEMDELISKIKALSSSKT